jgi:hypothetical protein
MELSLSPLSPLRHISTFRSNTDSSSSGFVRLKPKQGLDRGNTRNNKRNSSAPDLVSWDIRGLPLQVYPEHRTDPPRHASRWPIAPSWAKHRT